MKKRTRIKRLAALALSLVLALSMAVSAYAATYSGRVQVGDVYRYFDDGHAWKVYNSSSIKTFYPSTGGAVEAYCLTPQAAAGTASYVDGNWSGYSYAVQRAINLTMAYGSGGVFDYSAYDVYSHFATQMIIWEFVLGYRDPVTFEVDPAHAYCDRIFVDRTSGFSGYWVQVVYDQIISLLQAHGAIPSFAVPFRRMLTEENAIKLIWDGANYSATVTDNNWVLYDYDFPCTIPGVTMTRTQNKLTITATEDAAEQLTDSYESTAYGWCIDEASCDSVMLVSGSLQNVCALMNEPDPVPAYIHFLVEKHVTGSITVSKVNAAGLPLSGVTLLLESSADGAAWTAVSELPTDEAGSAKWENLTANGSVQYRVTEQSTNAGYSLLSEPLFVGSLPDGENTDIHITAYNSPNLQLPFTGGMGFVPNILFVMLMVFMGIYFMKKKEYTK